MAILVSVSGPAKITIRHVHSLDGPDPRDTETTLSFGEVCMAAEALRDHLLCMMPPKVKPETRLTRDELIAIADCPRTHDDDPAYIERAIDALIAAGVIEVP